ncbi:MAG TPA: nucleoside hydrolase [Pelolinea sp.]|nr:nucleoside hydrolase [Pelolinea sp.]
MSRKPVIIDCDTGTDDAIAIIAALYSPELDVRTLTTVVGNVELKHTSRNTLNLARYLGFDTRVAVGAPKPLLGMRSFIQATKLKEIQDLSRWSFLKPTRPSMTRTRLK